MTIDRDEDLANVIEEQDERSESLGSATRFHLCPTNATKSTTRDNI